MLLLGKLHFLVSFLKVFFPTFFHVLSLSSTQMDLFYPLLPSSNLYKLHLDLCVFLLFWQDLSYTRGVPPAIYYDCSDFPSVVVYSLLLSPLLPFHLKYHTSLGKAEFFCIVQSFLFAILLLCSLKYLASLFLFIIRYFQSVSFKLFPSPQSISFTHFSWQACDTVVIFFQPGHWCAIRPDTPTTHK